MFDCMWSFTVSSSVSAVCLPVTCFPTSFFLGCNPFSLSPIQRWNVFLINMCLILLMQVYYQGIFPGSKRKCAWIYLHGSPATCEVVQQHLQKCTAGVGGLPWFKFGKSICVRHFMNYEAVSAEWHGHLKNRSGNNIVARLFSLDGNCICLGSATHRAYLDVKYFPSVCQYWLGNHVNDKGDAHYLCIYAAEAWMKELCTGKTVLKNFKIKTNVKILNNSILSRSGIVK